MLALLVNLALAPGLVAAVSWFSVVPKGRELVGIGIGTAWTLVVIVIASMLWHDPFARFQIFAWALFLWLPAGLFALAGARYRTRPLLAWAAGIAATLLCVIAVDAFVVEPHWLQTTRVQITSEKVDQPLRIVVISDIQTDTPGPYEARVFREAAGYRPDLVLFPGDLIQAWPDDRPAARAALRELLAESELMSAPLGLFVVPGNVDAPGWTESVDGTPIYPFHAQDTTSAGPVQITGLPLAESFNYAIQIPAAPGFHIVFGHAPDFSLGDVRADLLVAGHTHGGQVQIPGLGPLITYSQVPRGWAAGGATDLGDGRTLVVSRGIGMERMYAPRLRFACRPELVVIDVLPSKGSP